MENRLKTLKDDDEDDDDERVKKSKRKNKLMNLEFN